MFEIISSLQNSRIKNLVRLRESTHRRRQGRFLIEGTRELQRALACHWPIETLYFCEDLFKTEDAYEILEKAEQQNFEIIKLTPDTFTKGSYRQGPDGLLATATQTNTPLSGLPLSSRPFIIVLERIEKPGNIGAVFRTANAAGVDALILTEPVADPFNPNVIRASQGAFFELPFSQTTNVALSTFLQENHIAPIPTSPEGTHLLWEANLREPVALLLGSEDNGLSAHWLDNQPAYKIPMNGVSDSLNVASMAAVSAFETVRQRLS